MKYFLLFGGALVICVLTFAGVLYWKYAKLIPEPSSEVVQFTPEKRAVLERLKKENKFQPAGHIAKCKKTTEVLRHRDSQFYPCSSVSLCLRG